MLKYSLESALSLHSIASVGFDNDAFTLLFHFGDVFR